MYLLKVAQSQTKNWINAACSWSIYLLPIKPLILPIVHSFSTLLRSYEIVLNFTLVDLKKQNNKKAKYSRRVFGFNAEEYWCSD